MKPTERRFAAPKVPEVFVFFWVTKLVTTGIGESWADFMAAKTLALIAGVGLIGFVAAVWWQMRAEAYHPVRYWTAVLMVAVFGTMVADAPHVVLGTPYWLNAAACLAGLAVVFVAWQRSEGTLSVHSIVTSRREAYYWAAVLLTFGLGTALGDTTASNLHLGYSGSIWVYAALILIPALAWRLGANSVVCFWVAYSLTRPLGASVADWLGKPAFKGGLALGDGPVTAVGLCAFTALVAYAAVMHVREAPPEARGSAGVSELAEVSR